MEKNICVEHFCALKYFRLTRIPISNLEWRSFLISRAAVLTTIHVREMGGKINTVGDCSEYRRWNSGISSFYIPSDVPVVPFLLKWSSMVQLSSCCCFFVDSMSHNGLQQTVSLKQNMEQLSCTPNSNGLRTSNVSHTSGFCFPFLYLRTDSKTGDKSTNTSTESKGAITWQQSLT